LLAMLVSIILKHYLYCIKSNESSRYNKLTCHQENVSSYN
jgi:hypothetical protein